ncbi:MAG: glycosyltransferase family 1 protein [Thiobacillaceae bacterium]|nr:glycosyltransferase family 1 protein [Thiobacillaceae bacterium]
MVLSPAAGMLKPMLAADLSIDQLPVEHRRLRLAVVTETYPPEINGVAMTVARFVRALQAREHQVQLIRPRQSTTDRPERETNLEQVLRPGVPIPRYAGLKMGLPAKSALKRLWSLKRPDLVHVVTEGPLGWSAVAAARALRLPVATDFHTNFHSYSLHYGLGWLKRPIAAYLRRFHSQARLTLVPSLSIRRELEQAGFRNLEVVARGVDTQLFDPARRSAALRAAWGVGEAGLAVLYVGRVAPEKNLELLLTAHQAIAQSRPDARLVVVGEGPALEGLRARAPDAVYCGARRGEVLAMHYASADVFLFPSLTETFGNVLLEAMASGLACVAFDYAAAAEHVHHGVNGLKAPYGDAQAFIQAAVRLACETDLRRTLGEAARSTALGLSWERIYARLEGLFLDLVRSHEVYHEKALLRSGIG